MRSKRLRPFPTLFMIAAIATPIGASAISAEPAVNRGSAHGCWYYDQAGFQGARAKIIPGDDAATLPAEWNDKISSLTCHPLCTLVAYDGENRSGSKKSFTGDVRSIPAAWNDKISSMSVTCRRRVRSVG